MTMLRKAGMKIIPLFMAAITALSSVSMPVHAENTEVAGIAVEETKEQAKQSVILDENRKIISLSQVVKGVKVTVSAKPGVLPDGTQLRVSPIEGVESLALISTVSEKAKEDGAVDASGVIALDITLVDADGNKFDPDENVTVAFEEITKDAYERSDSESFEVYHAVDGDTDQLVNMGASEEGNDLVFETDSFSPFIVVRAAAADAGRYHADIQYLTANESTGGKHFSYTGTTVEWVAPKEGVYHLEAVGAGVGGPDGSLLDRVRATGNEYGYGGYSEGYINLKKGDKIYVTVGGAGSPSTQKASSKGGFNGGGDGFYGAYSGGGATSFASVKLGDGTLKNYGNMADRNKVLLVAGGAGGFGTGNPFFGADNLPAWESPNGDGGGETTGAMYAFNSTTIVTQGTTQANGYAFGLGSPSMQIKGSGSYAAGGAGGGGWFGGRSSLYYHSVAGASGGTGGTGHVNVSKSAPLHLTRGRTTSTWAPVSGGKADKAIFGNGEAAINYVGEIKSTVILSLGTNAKYNGQSGDVKIEGKKGSTIDLSKLVVPNSGNTIIGWKVIYGDGTIPEKSQKFTFGEEDTNLFPLVYSKIDLSSTVQSSKQPEFKTYTYNDQTFLKWDEAGYNNRKNYKAYQSIDGGAYKELKFSEYEHLEANPAAFYYTGKAQTYKAPFAGTYTIYLYGGHAGGDGGSGGGKGAYLKGTMQLNEGDVLTINVGGAGRDSSGSSGNTTPGGWNGGGSCWWSGSGAGCTDIYLGGTRIAAAAGGGGATNGRSGRDGRISTASTDHLTSSKNGGSNGGYDAGGGGGGWRGGSMGITETTGDPNATGAWGGINGFTSAFKKLEESSDAVKSGSKGGSNGYAYIVPPQGGDIYRKQSSLQDTSDLAAPEVPYDGAVKTVNNGKATMIWYEPVDHGTTYRHKVQAISLDDGTNLGESNVTTDVITSGTVGYFYYYDTKATGTAGKSHTFTEKAEATIPILPDAPKTYLHVAAVDRAGNVGPTAHISVDAYVAINGSVTWVDKDNHWNLRPSSDTITLYQDGKEYSKVTLKTTNSYTTYTFEKLPAGHTYTVTQQDVKPYDAAQNQYDFVNTIALETEKTVLDQNGNDVKGKQLTPGDIVTYRITVTNNSLENRKVVVYDQLPWYLDYVSGDKSITLLKTDADVTNYSKSAIAPVPGYMDRLTPVIAASGSVSAKQEFTVSFKVKVKYAAGGRTIRNMADVYYEHVFEKDGKTPLDVYTNEVSNPVKVLPKGTITIRKTVNEVYAPFGQQSFIFEIKGTDVTGDPHTFHAQVTLNGTSGVTVVKDIPQGTYTVTEIPGIRYELRSIQPVKNVKVSGTAATATVTEVTGNAAEMEFRNTLTDYGDESHTAIVVNHMKAAQEEQLR